MPLTPPTLRANAPSLALRLGTILVSLAALIAHRFLRNPRLLPLIVPLWTRLTRAKTRFERLMAHVAAGRRPRRARPSRKATPGGRPPANLPAGHAWLVRAIGNEAAAHACQLEHLLSDPAMAEAIATHPAAARLLRPLCRMLGVSLTVGRPSGQPTTPEPAKPEPIPPKPTQPAPPRGTLAPRRLAAAVPRADFFPA